VFFVLQSLDGEGTELKQRVNKFNNCTQRRKGAKLDINKKYSQESSSIKSKFKTHKY